MSYSRASLLFLFAAACDANVAQVGASQPVSAESSARLNGRPVANPAAAYHLAHAGSNLSGWGYGQLTIETANGLTDGSFATYDARAEAGVDLTIETSSDGWYRYGPPVYDSNCGCCNECNPWVQPEILDHPFTAWAVGYKIDGVLQPELDVTSSAQHRATIHVPATATDRLEYWFHFRDAQGTSYWDSRGGGNYVVPIIPQGGALITFDDTGAPRLSGTVSPGGAVRIDYDFHRLTAVDAALSPVDMSSASLDLSYTGSSTIEGLWFLIPAKPGANPDIPAKTALPAIPPRVTLLAAFKVPLDATAVEIRTSALIPGQQPHSADEVYDGAMGLTRQLWGGPINMPPPYTFAVTGPCPVGRICNAVDALFEVNNATTFFGQNVYLVGSIPELGSWDPKHAVRMDAASYPKWRAELALPKNARFEFKFIKIDPAGRVEWEARSNRVGVTGNNSTAWFGGPWSF